MAGDYKQICQDPEKRLGGRRIIDIRPLYISFRDTLNANETKLIIEEIPANWAFRLEALTYKSDGDFDILIRDSSTSDAFMPNPVPIDLIAGIGMMPAFLPCPYIFVPNSSIEVTVTDTSGAVNNISIVMWGYKLIVV